MWKSSAIPLSPSAFADDRLQADSVWRRRHVIMTGNKPAAILLTLLLLLCAANCMIARRLCLRSLPRGQIRSRLYSSSAPTLTTTSSSDAERGLERWKVKRILEADEDCVGKQVVVRGWVRTVRDQKQFCFVEINDGSSLIGVQTVADSAIPSYSVCSQLSTGAAAEVVGTITKSLGKGQKYEVKASEVRLIGDSPPDSYPLQKKRHSQEFLRTIAHLRPRTNTISAVARVRSALALATHVFFQQQGFIYLQSPLITASDCEGAGEMFRVTTLPLNDLEKLPRSEADANSADFSKDFFGKPSFLTVSGQLSGETYACALGDIYTFGPTFRAENSQTSRHLAEFHMIEPEMAFANLWDAMENAEKFVKFVVRHAMDTCAGDFDFFEKFLDKDVKARLARLVDKPFARVAYREAVRLLQEEISKDPSKWQYPVVEFGTDLQTEHERWLAEQKFNSCVFVHNYPRKIKAFYMRDNADGETVDSFDLLVPGIGELVGGSQREERLETLRAKMHDFSLREEDYWWYLDLRRYGSVPHAGYGLGFERLVCYVTGVENIREAIAYPRFPSSCEF